MLLYLLALPTYIGVTTFGNITKSLIGSNGAFNIFPHIPFFLYIKIKITPYPIISNKNLKINELQL